MSYQITKVSKEGKISPFFDPFGESKRLIFQFESQALRCCHVLNNLSESTFTVKEC